METSADTPTAQTTAADSTVTEPTAAETTVTDLPSVPAANLSGVTDAGPDTNEALALLSVSAARDDLGAALSKRPRAKIPSLTLLLVVLLVAGLGFFGGELVGKHNAGTGGGLSAAALRGAFAGRTGAGTRTGTGTGAGAGASGFAGGGFGAAAGNATIGSVELVQGSILYVETTAGAVVRISTTPSTKITVSSTGTLKSLQHGDEVIVSGTKSSSGVVAATSITQSSLGAGAGAAG